MSGPPVKMEGAKGMKQRPLPASAIPDSQEDQQEHHHHHDHEISETPTNESSSSNLVSGEFDKIRQKEIKSNLTTSDDMDKIEDFDENGEQQQQEGEVEEGEESELSLLGNLFCDVLQCFEDFYDETMPDDEETAAERRKLPENLQNVPPTLSIGYIDKTILPASVWAPLLCDLTSIHVQKLKLFSDTLKKAKIRHSSEGNGLFRTGSCHLEICGCDLGPENGELVATKLFPALASCCQQGVPSLSINLENNRLLMQGFAKMTNVILASSNLKNTLRSLNLRENALRDESMPNLCKILHACPHLQELSIGTCHIFPTGIEILVRDGLLTSPYCRSTLKTLNIEFNTLGNKGVAILCQGLAQCCAFEALNIGDNSISDEGAIVVAETLMNKENCGPLRWLDMAVNQIGSKGALAIAKALSNNNSRIEHLDIGCNSIGIEGGEEICKASKSAPRLVSLDLTTTDLSDKAGKILLEAMESRPMMFKEAFIFECHDIEFETKTQIVTLMNARRSLKIPKDDESFSNMKKVDEKSKREVFVNRLIGGIVLIGLVVLGGWVYSTSKKSSRK